jgi:hypothetical protein
MTKSEPWEEAIVSSKIGGSLTQDCVTSLHFNVIRGYVVEDDLAMIQPFESDRPALTRASGRVGERLKGAEWVQIQYMRQEFSDCRVRL